MLQSEHGRKQRIRSESGSPEAIRMRILDGKWHTASRRSHSSSGWYDKYCSAFKAPFSFLKEKKKNDLICFVCSLDSFHPNTLSTETFALLTTRTTGWPTERARRAGPQKHPACGRVFQTGRHASIFCLSHKAQHRHYEKTVHPNTEKISRKYSLMYRTGLIHFSFGYLKAAKQSRWKIC